MYEISPFPPDTGRDWGRSKIGKKMVRMKGGDKGRNSFSFCFGSSQRVGAVHK